MSSPEPVRQGADRPDAFVAFDVMAAGYAQDIVEIGAVRYEDGVEVSEYSTFVNPGRAVSAEDLEGSGIPPSALAAAPGLDEVIWAFDGFLKGAVLAAHASSYNVWLLRRAYEKVNRALLSPTADALRYAPRLYSILRRRYPYPDFLMNDFMAPGVEPYRAVECARLSGEEYLRAFDTISGC
jgi:DNA polymerase III alpha subunit (gram-positive type)